MEKVKHYFGTYKESNTCFETSDGFLFHRIGDATAHGNTLADKKVKTWTRDEVAQSTDDNQQPTPTGKPDSTWKVDDLKKYATDNSIDLGEAKTKADILAKIDAATKTA